MDKKIATSKNGPGIKKNWNKTKKAKKNQQLGSGWRMSYSPYAGFG